MKADLEILILNLILLRVITSLRLTSKTTVNTAQLKVLVADAKSSYMLAYHCMEDYNMSDKRKQPFGFMFFYLFMFFTYFPFALNNAKTESSGLFCPLLDSNDFWRSNCIFLFTGIEKYNGMDMLEKKRITLYRLLGALFAMSHNPKDVRIKKLTVSLDKLMGRVFDGFVEDVGSMTDKDPKKALRLQAIRGSYRMIDLIKQISCHTNSRGVNVADPENIAFVMDKESRSKAVALGHHMDVVLARHLSETKSHRVFDRHFI